VHGKQPEDRLFTRGKGGDMEVKRFDKLWRVVTAAAGMKQRLLVHDLRRTATRNMLEAGMTKEDIKVICGRKTDSMFNRYALRKPLRCDPSGQTSSIRQFIESLAAGAE
jgi:site-specific recombinase XerD